MTPAAPRSIDAYLKQLRAALADQDPALVQDAVYDAEEYLRAEIASHPDKSEADVLELIASTYGAPEEVAAAYRETEAKVKAALQPPMRPAAEAPGVVRRFFGVYTDPRAYTSLLFMLLALATGILYFTVAVTGISVSLSLAFLIIGIPFFVAFIGIVRVIALGEGRLIEAVTGERMPRRPVHPGPQQGLFANIWAMLKDSRTWTTLAYLILMLPLGIVYFVIAVVGLSVGLVSVLALPLAVIQQFFGALGKTIEPAWLGTPPVLLMVAVFGVVVVTTLMHTARGIGRVHAHIAKRFLVTPG
jgi:Putative sensor